MHFAPTIFILSSLLSHTLGASFPFFKRGEIKEFINERGETILIRRSLIGENKREDDVDLYTRCSCRCRSKYYNDDWFCCECSDTGCFPSAAKVLLIDGSTIEMSRLEKGDYVQAATEDGRFVFSEVRAFLHKQYDSISDYYSITTSSNSTVTLSRSHLIYTRKNASNFQPIYADHVAIGDELLIRGNDELIPAEVTDVSIVTMQGAYVPLTMEGTIIVDGTLASCYASFNHDLAHLAMTPLRWYPEIVEWIFGTAAFVNSLKDFGKWMLPNELQYHSTTSNLDLLSNLDFFV